MSAYIDVGYDAARALGPISFTLTETGGGGATGPITLSGQYLHTTALSSGNVSYVDPVTGFEEFGFDQTYLKLSDAFKVALDAVGNATYTVTFDVATRRYAVTATGGGVTAFALTPLTASAVQMFGTLTLATPLSWASAADVWHLSYPDNLGWSRWEMRDAAPEGVETLSGADGSVRGLSAIGTARLLDFVVPKEPRAAVRNDETYGNYTPRGWTWQRLVYRARSIEPCVIATGDGQAHVAYLRPDYQFAPRLMAADFLDVQDIPLSWHVVGQVLIS